MRHELKTDSKNFEALAAGVKLYEIRLNDRDFTIVDELILRETRFTGKKMKEGKPLIYTGSRIYAWITHILSGPIYGLKDGWVILALDIFHTEIR